MNPKPSGVSGSAADEGALWERFIGLQDSDARSQLIERYLITAKMLAAALYANRSDDSIDFYDYLQYARVGLLEAIDRYDPGREASFKTFAAYRIRGAILNGIEKSTELASQKAQRRRLRRERLKSIQEDADAAAEGAFARMVDLTLNLAIGYLLEDSGVWHPDDLDRAADPYASLEMKRLGERIALLMQALPQRERDVVRGHYFEHKDFSEIAGLLGISRGRVSQLHARALRLLRAAHQSLSEFDRRG